MQFDAFKSRFLIYKPINFIKCHDIIVINFTLGSEKYPKAPKYEPNTCSLFELMEFVQC